MDGLCKAALQTWVGINEVMHLVGIAGNDTDKLTTVILQTLQQRINSFRTEAVLIAGLQRICLINEEDTTHCRINQLIGLDSGLTREASHQLTAVGLHQLSTGQNTQGTEHIGHDTSHCRLTCSGITCKDIVLALERIGFSTTDL